MSDNATQSEKPAIAKLGLGSMLVVILGASLAAVAGSGACLYFLLKSGRIPINVHAAAAEEKVEVPKTKQIALEPMLINLADAGGTAYLRAAITLNVADDTKKDAKKEEGKEAGADTHAAARDAVLAVLGASYSQDLLQEKGKTVIKTRIRDAVNAKDPSLKVKDVFFTDFLVQR